MLLLSPVSTGKAVAAEFSEKNVAFMAGSIAYNAFISLLPLLILLVFAVSVVGTGELEGRLVDMATTYLTPAAGETVGDALGDAEDGAGLSIVGFVALLWGTLKIFRGLDTAFAEIYETTRETSFVGQLRDSLIVLVALGISITAIVGASAVFAVFQSYVEAVPTLGLVSPTLLVIGLTIAFFPLYYIFPDVDLTVRQVLPGLLFAAVGWAVLQGLFQIYIAVSSTSDTYGALAGIVLLITWLYFGGMVLLLGAVLNSVTSGHATGEGGGVGEGAADRGPDDERVLVDERLDRDAAADYLRELREDITGRYEGMEPTDGGTERRQPPADGEIAVAERSYLEEGEPHGEVRLRWRQEW